MNQSDYPRGIEVVGSIIIENDRRQILVVQSVNWDTKWVLPGGHIEPGERIIDALVREGEEETGLKLSGHAIFYAGELIGTPDFKRKAHFIYFDVYASAVGGVLSLQTSELKSSQWIDPKLALRLDLGESYAVVIQKFIELRSSEKPDGGNSLGLQY